MDPPALPTFQNLPTHLCDPFLGAVRTTSLQWLLSQAPQTTLEMMNSNHPGNALLAYNLLL